MQFIKPNFKAFTCKCLAAASLALTASSCTLSEPDSINGNGTSGQLQSISFMGQQAVYMKYDGQGRVTEVAMPFHDTKIKVSYNPLHMLIEEYDSYEVGDEGYEYRRYSTLDWKNIRTNAAGNITSADVTETIYHYDWYDPSTGQSVKEYTEVDNYSHNLRYDSEEHLISISDAEQEKDSEYKWVDGCMVSGNNTNEEYFTCEYSDVPNVTGQWTPFWGAASLFQMTGLFGKAPEKMIRAIRSEDGYNTYQNIYFSYKLNDKGQISVMKYNDSSDDITMSMVFTYK